MTAVWLEVLDISGVPVEQYGACYAAAMQARAERKANGESLSHLTADELAAEWIKIRNLHAEMQREEMRHKALTANAAGACERCFGTGTDSTPDGVIDCDHEPLTTAQREERDRVRDENLRWIREQMKHVGAPKPPAREVPKVPAGLHYKCQSCLRTLNVLREMDGRECGDLLNRGTHEGGLKICRGTLKRAIAHKCQIAACAKFRRVVMALPGETCAACGEGLEVFEGMESASDLEH